MNKAILISLALFPGSVPDTAARPDILPEHDGMTLCSRYSRIERSNFWNMGRNAAGIRQDSATVSYAGMTGRYAAGGYRDYSEGSSMWGTEAGAKTITHLERISLKGSFSFGHAVGYDMCGSMSGRPGYYPFDVLEFTPGTKTRQTYAFSGGIAVDSGPGWRIGAEIDYEASDYVKRKDLRHTDYLLDMTVIPSVMYHKGHFAAGISAIFGKNSETIDAEVLGISSSTYYAFLDKGLMYGAYESWEGSGIHLSESGINGFPARELMYGSSMQVQWKSLYAELEYLYSDGKAGEKQTVWFRFPGHRAAVRLGYSVVGNSGRHLLRVGVNWMLQHNNESVLQKVTENGVTVPVVYGYNRLLTRKTLSVNPQYEFYSSSFAFAASLAIRAAGNQAAPVFPFVFVRNELSSSLHTAASYSIRKFDIFAGLSAGAGKQTEKESTSTTSAIPEAEPFRLSEWNDAKSEYRTAPWIAAKAGFICRFRKGIFIGAGMQYTHGFCIQFLNGTERLSATLSIGCEF